MKIGRPPKDEFADNSRQIAVRALLNKAIAEQGIKQSFIAHQIGIDCPILSRFKTGKVDLWVSTIDDLEQWLMSRT